MRTNAPPHQPSQQFVPIRVRSPEPQPHQLHRLSILGIEDHLKLLAGNFSRPDAFPQGAQSVAPIQKKGPAQRAGPKKVILQYQEFEGRYSFFSVLAALMSFTPYLEPLKTFLAVDLLSFLAPAFILTVAVLVAASKVTDSTPSAFSRAARTLFGQLTFHVTPVIPRTQESAEPFASSSAAAVETNPTAKASVSRIEVMLFIAQVRIQRATIIPSEYPSPTINS